MPEPTPDPKAALEKLKVPFLEALMDRTPASLRRAGAAAAGVVIPFANSYLQSKFGFGVSDSVLLAMEGLLAGYITQSVLNGIHERGTEAKVAVATAQNAADVLSQAAQDNK